MNRSVLAVLIALSAAVLSSPVAADTVYPATFTVSRGKTVLLARMYSTGVICGGPALSGWSSGSIKFGKLRFERGREVIPSGRRLGGDGHMFCRKETGVNRVFYDAGGTPGTDTFYVMFRFGGGPPDMQQFAVEVK